MESHRTKALRRAVEKGYIATVKGEIISPSGDKLKLCDANHGYLSFTVRTVSPEKSKVNVPVHRFVAYCKYGEKLFEEGIEVRHLNGNSLDNHWDNIEIGTSSENSFDKPVETRNRVAASAARKLRKLSDEQLVQFLEDRRNGFTYRELMEKYGLAKSTVSYIVNGKTYT